MQKHKQEEVHMRKLFDAKSLAAGVVIGTLDITTVFAAGGGVLSLRP